MNRPVCRYLFAATALLCCAASAKAVVIVAEDFLYDEPTKAIFNLAGFTLQDYGGGQNGPGGVWDDRWVSVGGTTIVGADLTTPPLNANPHTAVVTEVATAASLQRTYVPTGAGASASTIYFAADFKVDDVATPNIFAELGILSPSATLDIPSVSIGITDSEGLTPATFFAKIGTTVVAADPVANAANALASGASVRIVGKLELNAVVGAGDYDADGIVGGGDFLLWQRQLGSNVTPSTGADGDGNGTVNANDLEVWKGAVGGGAERLTVYFNPTGVEQTAATVLTGTASLINSMADTTLSRIVSLNGDPAPRDSDRPHFIDNVAIGTTWADVAAVDVPRLTLEVNTATGATRWLNNSGQSIPLAYYEILSPSGSLSTGGWNSLDEQNTSGGTWAENNPLSGQLVESNLTSSTTVASGGGSLALGAAFTTGGTQDLIARWGTKEGFDGLLNLANVVYVSGAAAVPEPASSGLLLVAAAAVLRRRAWRGAA